MINEELERLVPVAWVIPGDDTARSDGSIDAMAFRDGEFTAPVYSEATILSLIQRVKEAERLLTIEKGIRAAAQQNFENMKQYSECAYDNGRKAGRAEALEEAAKVAEDLPARGENPWEWPPRIAAAIRKLGEGGMTLPALSHEPL